MKIFLDTADRTIIKKWLPTGLIDGITTNPSNLSHEGPKTAEVVRELCSLLPSQDISIELVLHEPEAMYKQAHEIAKLAPNVIVKVPCKLEYLSLIKRLRQDGIRINVTLVFSVLQALAVAKLDVTYISPFVGRLEEIGADGIGLIEKLVVLKQTHGFTSQILAASIRSLAQWQEVALLGADAVTVPPVLFEQAFHHPLTDIGIKIFDKDWQKLGRTTLFE